jgi:hypothetical protein
MILRALLAGSCALGVALVASARAPERPTEAQIQACTALGAGTLASARLELRTDRGILRCDQERGATGAFVVAGGLLESLGPALRPGYFAIELRSGRRRFEAVPDRGLLIVSEHYAGADAGAWAHEIAHLAAHGPRPRSVAARRLAAAIDEGVADYFAAALTESPLVGRDLGQPRDLRRPPMLPESDWAMLARDDFDPHRFGWKLAALLWSAEPSAGPLLEDCVRCLSGGVLAGRESPAAVLGALSSCSERSRALLAEVLRSWAPAELFPASPVHTQEVPCESSP